MVDKCRTLTASLFLKAPVIIDTTLLSDLERQRGAQEGRAPSHTATSRSAGSRLCVVKESIALTGGVVVNSFIGFITDPQISRPVVVALMDVLFFAANDSTQSSSLFWMRYAATARVNPSTALNERKGFEDCTRGATDAHHGRLGAFKSYETQTQHFATTTIELKTVQCSRDGGVPRAQRPEVYVRCDATICMRRLQEPEEEQRMDKLCA